MMVTSSDTRAARAEYEATLRGAAHLRATSGGDEVSAPADAHVASGTVVRADDDASATLAWAPGVEIRLAPGTSLSVVNPAWLPAEHPGAKPLRAMQVALASGAIDLIVHDEAAALGLLVQMPGGGTLALWRGAAHAEIAGEACGVALYEGTAIAGAAEKWKPLATGDGAVLVKGSAPAAHAIPTAPAWDDRGAAFALVRGDDRAHLPMAWRAVPGAARYRVEIARDGDGARARTIETPTPSLDASDLPPGRWAARVRALSADGVAGPLSTPHVMRVAKVTLPPGSFVGRDGAVVLAAGTGITLDDARDLEVATMAERDATAGLEWADGRDAVALDGARARYVHVRARGVRGEAKMVLAKRELRAIVTMTPKSARWPQDPVDVVVRAEDPSGRLDPAREPLAFDVRVNLDPAPLEWTRDGATFRARVMPHVPPGPWVVRVDVKDGSGTVIGASFLEVIGPRIEGTAPRVADSTEVKITR